MITLSVIAYIVVCLSIAYYKYGDIQIDRYRGNVNWCYLNTKRSLVYGFLFIPSLVFCLAVFLGFCHLIIEILKWIIITLP